MLTACTVCHRTEEAGALGGWQVAAAAVRVVRAKQIIKQQAAKVVVLLAKLEQAPHLQEPVVEAVRKLQEVTAAPHGVVANQELPEVLVKAVMVASLLLQQAVAAAATASDAVIRPCRCRAMKT